MKKYPTAQKRFYDLLPGGTTSPVRTLLLRSTVAGISLLGLAPGSPPGHGESPPSSARVAVTINNREDRKAQAKLILTLNGGSDVRFAAHLSHSSHRSHSSHSSHRSHSSHSSHYSSSSGTKPSPPPPPSSPPPPPSPPPSPPSSGTVEQQGRVSSTTPPASEITWPQGFLFTEKDAEKTVIEISRIDIKKTYNDSTITGVDRTGKTFVFHFLPYTRIRQLTPQESSKTIAEYFKETNGIPLKVDQEVLVMWRVYAPMDQKIAVKFIIY